jgi:hypothetical protein
VVATPPVPKVRKLAPAASRKDAALLEEARGADLRVSSNGVHARVVFDVGSDPGERMEGEILSLGREHECGAVSRYAVPSETRASCARRIRARCRATTSPERGARRGRSSDRRTQGAFGRSVGSRRTGRESPKRTFCFSSTIPLAASSETFNASCGVIHADTTVQARRTRRVSVYRSRDMEKGWNPNQVRLSS